MAPYATQTFIQPDLWDPNYMGLAACVQRAVFGCELRGVTPRHLTPAKCEPLHLYTHLKNLPNAFRICPPPFRIYLPLQNLLNIFRIYLAPA